MTPSPTADLFESAVRYHSAGQLAEAERLYRRILGTDPNHVDSLHLLGVVAHQVGRSDVAINLIGRAIAQNDRLPEPHYNIGLAFAALNRLDDAVAHFTQATRLQPTYAAAHLNLGNTLAARGNWQEAAASYERVLRIDPRAAQAHYNLANMHMELGAAEQAIEHYRHALAHKPDYAEAHNNLGTALKSQGRLDEAATCHRQALALKPDLVEAGVNLGNLLRTRGELDEAEACYRQALALRPDYAEAHNNLGTMLMASGRLDEAATHFERAVAVKPRLAEGHLNLARVMIASGDPARALGPVRMALDIRETSEARLLFVICVGGLQPNAAAAELRPQMIRALSEPWARPSRLAAASARLLKLDPVIAACIARARAAWPGRPSADSLPGPSDLAVLSADGLLRRLLEVTPITDADIERMLTAIRSGMLERAARGTDDGLVDDATLDLYCSVARQCFINEYVYDCAATELAQAHLLRDRLASAIASADPIPALWLVAVASYVPLHSLPGVATLLGRGWSDAIDGLFTQQVREPEEERELRAVIPRLTAIEDHVSLRVRQQYEENPYPRWVQAAPATRRASKEDYLTQGFSVAAVEMLADRGVGDILVAGCGTGQQAIEAGQGFSEARVLAVDLSLASLSYAERKTRAMGVKNIQYAQADILELGAIGRTFDVILVAGVLHHLANPFAGWRVLLSLLRAGGLMQVGLYSQAARRQIVAARALIRDCTSAPTADVIRRCRHELMAHPDAEPVGQLVEVSDFYSVSECRDLLFHVQEHQLTLPEIKEFLAANDLKFLGFELDAAIRRQYRSRFPADQAMTDLDLWHVFETENPRTFIGMYQFWVQSAR